MKRDYQKQTDEIVRTLDSARPRLLLHCCCGPCATYVLDYLQPYFDICAFYYNPNIHPAQEYEKRLLNLEKVTSAYGGSVSLMRGDYSPEGFMEASAGLDNEPEGGSRCESCFALRLEETARRAREGGFDYFCTTLSVSPHKSASAINDIGLAMEERFGVKWLPSDFKKREGYKRSVELSREYGLYRQEYCGCIYSLAAQEKRMENEQPK